MKNIISAAFLMSFSIFATAQTLPNSEFELWVNYGLFEEPELWNTPNPFTTIVSQSAITVSKSTDAYSGDFSVKLETIDIFGGSFQVPGVITLAQINVNFISAEYSISGGMALKENVSKLSGMYKYQGVEGDSATVLIYNFKRDNEGEIDTIGFGSGYLHDANSWTHFTVNMENLNNHVPDTFNVIILSSALELHPGSVLYVDSLTIETNTGIINLGYNQISVNVYPNPSSDFVQFVTKDYEKERIIRVYNIAGKLINTSDFSERKTKISLKEFPSGIYAYHVIKQNEVVNKGSFIKN